MTKIKLIGDLHIGSKFSRTDLIKTALDGDDPIILLGDLIDAINPKDPRYDDDCIMTIDEQINCILSLLKGKNILYMISGNHEVSLERYTGVSIMKIISEQLDIPYNGPNCYYTADDGTTFYTYHGSGGGAFKGTILQKMEKVPMHRSADVYVQGHSHQLFTVPTIVEVGTKQVVNWLINSGSFMSDASYARTKNLPPSVLGYAVYDLEKKYAYPVLMNFDKEITNVAKKMGETELRMYYKDHSYKEAAEFFNISERTLARRLKDFGISKKDL